MEHTDSQISDIKITHIWDYKNHFREYLLLTARKNESALEDRYVFPERIELSDDWHKSLEDIRQATNDGKERWALVGFNGDSNTLHISTVAAKGYDSYVSGEIMQVEMTKAEKLGIRTLVGDVHSHPRSFSEKSATKLFNHNDIGLKAQFSVGDYYALLCSSKNTSFMGLVDGDHNLFVFKSRQTPNTTQFLSAFDQDSFEKYWYEMYGYRYLGSVKEFGARRTIPVDGYANPIGMHKTILDKHQLVLYQGFKGKDLSRIYPK